MLREIVRLTKRATKRMRGVGAQRSRRRKLPLCKFPIPIGNIKAVVEKNKPSSMQISHAYVEIKERNKYSVGSITEVKLNSKKKKKHVSIHEQGICRYAADSFKSYWQWMPSTDDVRRAISKEALPAQYHLHEHQSTVAGDRTFPNIDQEFWAITQCSHTWTRKSSIATL